MADKTQKPKAEHKTRVPCKIIAVRLLENGDLHEVGSGYEKPSEARRATIARIESKELEPAQYYFLTRRGELSATVEKIPAQERLVIK